MATFTVHEGGKGKRRCPLTRLEQRQLVSIALLLTFTIVVGVGILHNLRPP